jgi:hypothetical protein
MGADREWGRGKDGHLPPLHKLEKRNELYQILIPKIKNNF